MTYQCQDKPVKELISDLANQFDIHISFSSQRVDTTLVSLDVREKDITAFLNEVFDPLHLQISRSKGNFFYLETKKRKVVLKLSDDENQDRIPYATIGVKGARISGFSDIDGLAVFEVNYDDQRTLTVAGMGYKSVDIPLAEGLTDTIEVKMEFESVALPDVVIEYQNKAIQIEQLSRTTLDPKNMEALPGLAESDVLLSTQLLPGIESNDETASGLNVRGGNKDELLTYWDRIPVYQQGHFFGSLTSFIPTTVNQISAYKNHIPSSFTGSTSGLLDITVTDSVPKVFDVVTNSNMTHSDALVAVPMGKKFGVLLAGRNSYMHAFQSPTFKSFSDKLYSGSRQEDILSDLGDGDEEESFELSADADMRYSDVNGKVNFYPTAKDQLSVSSILSRDSYDLFGSNPSAQSQIQQTHEVDFWGANLFYKRSWDSTLTTTASWSRSSYNLLNNFQEIYEADEETSLQISNNLENTEVKLGAELKGKGESLLNIGYQFNDYANSVQYSESESFEAATTDTTQAQTSIHGGYISWHKWSGDRWKVNPQLRMDYYSRSQRIIVNPVFDSQWKLGRNTWAKLSYGHYAQALRLLNESDLSVSNVSESVWLLADPDEELEIIRSRQITLGLLYEKSGLLVDMDLYYKRTIGSSLLDQFSDNEDEDLDFITGETSAKGLDLMIKKKFGRYQTWLSYSLSQTLNHFDDLSETPFNSALDRPHQLRWVHNYYYNQLEFSVGLIVKSGSPYTLASGLEVIDEDEEEYAVQYGELNTARLPIYHRLDCSVWYKFPRKSDSALHGMFGASILNVYNRNNVWRRYYLIEDIDDNDEPELVEEERYFLGFTPNVTLKLQF